MFQVLKCKLLWSTNNSGDEKRRHTFRDRTGNSVSGDNCLQEKRCMSMPSVSSVAPPSQSSSSHRSRLLRLQDRRFHQRFHQVSPDERLVNYFSCALVSDLLLQGHLFITKNYLAFYSNIFGHKTEILISVSEVVKVTKEKTAKFFPNAVGVYTDSDKYVFGSMLSRDSAYRVIQQTWIQSTDPGLGLHDDSESEVSPALMLMADEDSSMSSGVSGPLMSDDVSQAPTTDTSPSPETSPLPPGEDRLAVTPAKNAQPPERQKRHHLTPRCGFDIAKGYVVRLEQVITTLSQLSRTSLLFMMSTVLLVILFVSTSVLLYRIHLVHQRLVAKEDFSGSNASRFFQSPTSGSDISNLVKSLEAKIRSLAEIRHALEELLLMANKYQHVPAINSRVT